jgi:two-component system, NarL family, response regulator DevR
VGEAGDFATTIRHVNALRPDVLILDIRMPDGLTFHVSNLRAHFVADSRIVAVSFAFDQEARDAARLVGADAVLDKGRLHAELIPAIENVAQNGGPDAPHEH